METVTITRETLRLALQAWEQAYREGRTLSHEEGAQLSVDEHARLSCNALWVGLGGSA